MKIPSSSRQYTALELQLTPLIDCVFLLLIYFIWTSSFARNEFSLPGKISAPMNRAGAQPREPSLAKDFDPVLVEVRQHGREVAWTVQGAPIGSLAELRQSLAAFARIKPDIPVIIDPASDVPLGEVLQIFDLARLSGLLKIQLAATEAVP